MNLDDDDVLYEKYTVLYKDTVKLSGEALKEDHVQLLNACQSIGELTAQLKQEF